MIAENCTRGTPLLKVKANDLDISNNAMVRYVIRSRDEDAELFVIDSYSGQISVAKQLDRETKDQLNFYVSYYL